VNVTITNVTITGVPRGYQVEVADSSSEIRAVTYASRSD